MNLNLINIVFIFLFITAVIYLIAMLSQKKIMSRIATFSMIISLAFNTIAVIQRWMEAGRPPLSNMYEAMVFFSFSIMIMHLFFEWWLKINNVGFFSAIFALLAISFASFYTDGTIQPLMPALQSNWLIFHVITYFISYGALAISMVTAIIALIKNREQKNYNTLTYKIISFSFPFLTLGLISGAVWAKQAWGDYWSWDPKEMWSLITWFLYLNYLHLPYTLPQILRKMNKSPDLTIKTLNICAVLAFFFVIFTYLGVNYLLSGLHSYAN